MSDRSPMETINQDNYEDPNPEEATEPNHRDDVVPAKGVKPLGGK